MNAFERPLEGPAGRPRTEDPGPGRACAHYASRRTGGMNAFRRPLEGPASRPRAKDPGPGRACAHYASRRTGSLTAHSVAGGARPDYPVGRPYRTSAGSPTRTLDTDSALRACPDRGRARAGGPQAVSTVTDRDDTATSPRCLSVHAEPIGALTVDPSPIGGVGAVHGRLRRGRRGASDKRGWRGWGG
jgi:hypothetical protein